MGAHYTDVALSNANGTITQNSQTKIISIESGSATITASLTYLCAKVRYTLFFDNTVTRDNDGNATSYGYSYPINKFEYQLIGVRNARQDAALFPDHKTEEISDVIMVIKNIIDDPTDPTKGCVASVYPSADDFADWIDPNIQTSEKSLTPLGVGAVIPTTGKIAYQGLIYLPENKAGKNSSENDIDSEDPDKKTCLRLIVKLDGEEKAFIINLPDNENNSSNYLQHGTFYDIVARITAQGIDFKVRVKKWVKSSDKAIPMPLNL